MKKGQASIEYLMVIGFVSFSVLGVLALAYMYTSSASDSIKENDLENMIVKIISTSEYVYYSGVPALATLIVSAPAGIENIEFKELDGKKNIVVTYRTSSGQNIRSFSSNVAISLPTETSRLITKGTKKLKIEAKDNKAEISFAT